LHEIVVKINPDNAGYEYYNSYGYPRLIRVAGVGPPQIQYNKIAMYGFVFGFM
jgi:hypothetical protein